MKSKLSMSPIAWRERAGVAAAMAIGWLPVAAFWIYSKQIRIHDKYFPLIYAVSGLEGAPSPFDRLVIFAPDIMAALLLVPAAIFSTSWLAPRSRVLRGAWIVFSVLTALLLFANLHSWGTVGQFLSGTAAINAAAFAAEQPVMIGAYIGLRGLAKLGLIVLAVLLCSLVLVRYWHRRWLGTLTLGTLAVVLAGSAVAYGVTAIRSTLKPLPITRDFVLQSLEALADVRSKAPAQERSSADIRQDFDRLTRTPAPVRSPYFGTAKDHDLIVFVLETGSSRFVDLPADLDSFPALKQLAPRSAIARAHHTVFPATAESLFSLFTGVYPARSLYATCIVDQVPGRVPPFNGFVSVLQSNGYNTAAYLPFTSVVPLDKALFGNLGLNKLYYAQQHPNADGLSRDAMALRELKSDIEGHIKAGRRYAALFLPQIGHAPWSDRPQGRSVRAHGKVVAQAQDAWLAEVIRVLAAHGRLDKTVIVLTGDHGIRTTNEDPDFPSGLVDTYSFHVPLLIYAPHSFSTNEILAVTTHVDVSPTILDLFGAEGSSEAQGVQLWHPNIDKRRVFFLANWYFGADGYRDGADHYMHSEVLGLSFQNRTLSFSPREVMRSTVDAEQVHRHIERLYAIQQAWITDRLCAQQARTP